jgi:hypothetical protein
MNRSKYIGFVVGQVVMCIGAVNLLWYSVEYDRAICDVGGALEFGSNPMRFGVVPFCLAGFIVTPMIFLCSSTRTTT